MTVGVDVRAVDGLQCDVLVIGGGAAGVATAVTASRQGLNVILLERYGFCGGGAVAGLSGTVCGMYLATDRSGAKPEVIVSGFAQEFCDALEQRGGLGAPVRYGKTWTRVHDPLVWRDAADALLETARVKVIYHAVATGVLLDGGERVEGVTAWTKQGPLSIRARVTVDASGDADLVAMAGFDSFMGDGARVQNPTMIFRLQGVDVERFTRAYGDDTIMGEAISSLLRERQLAGDELPRSKIWLFPTTRPGELLCNCTRITGSDGRELNAIFYNDFTEGELNGRKQVRSYARFLKDYVTGCENSFVNDTGVQVGVRQTRQVEGAAKLMNADVITARKFSDGIARSPWPIELHAGAKPKVEWVLDDYYEVPYGCFVPSRGDGLLVAGRCLSAEHEAVASARVTAQCFSYGHAIGHAATLVVREDAEPRHIDAQAIRSALRQDGTRL
ncbi:FAD-dependent oxidoreductase [Paraburkholderia antibiotica]|uniref:FAD-dependent oxidoreductase n=1 Tax=Paraburkholderia antibiotica TaxID=2728839 RepID=A0A7X9ZX64_9BURK|nr:FAD-dependent oxidoreductase [Paraburkholderia antibiotica]NML31824.1 FAD-dependent oxidoreductase [Paraburkholderia antibiotica]